MSNNKQAFLDFVSDMTTGPMGEEYERSAKADQLTGQRLAEFDPHLASLVTKTGDARLEVLRYLKARAERR